METGSSVHFGDYHVSQWGSFDTFKNCCQVNYIVYSQLKKIYINQLKKII